MVESRRALKENTAIQSTYPGSSSPLLESTAALLLPLPHSNTAGRLLLVSPVPCPWQDGNTSLMGAARGYVDVVNLLIENRADVNAVGKVSEPLISRITQPAPWIHSTAPLSS